MFHYYEERGVSLPEQSSLYERAFNHHHQSACAYITDAGLIHDAIALAQQPLTKPNMAEFHPAMIKLCDFWRFYKRHEGIFEPAVPIIHCFVDKKNYLPLITSLPQMDLALSEKQQGVQRQASVMFAQKFLVTYLGSRYHSIACSKPSNYLHYTVYKRPYLIEDNTNQQTANCLAWFSLQGLQQFPKHFPDIWQQLQRQYARG